MDNEYGYQAHGTCALNPDNYLTEDERYITADCSHEVYNGQYLYVKPDGETLCQDCVEEEFAELKPWEKADLIGCDSQILRL